MSVSKSESNQPKNNESSAGKKHAKRIRLVVLIFLTIGLTSVAVWGVLRFRNSAARTTQDRLSRKHRPSSENPQPLNTIRTSSQEQQSAEFNDLFQRIDPSKDGWETEALSESASKQLKQLGKLLAHPEKIDASHLVELATTDCTCSPLRPEDLKSVFSDRALAVSRPDTKVEVIEMTFDLPSALRSLCTPYEGADDVRVKFKIISVEKHEREFETVVYYQAAGRFSKEAVQQSATWHCRWTLPEQDKIPRLISIRIENFEEVVNREKRGKWFVECTEAVLGANSSYRDQLLFGIDHWRSRLHDSFGLAIQGHYGIAVGDVNGDGLDDLFVCRPGGLPNKLFVQNSDGTAQDVSSAAGVDMLNGSQCVLLLDLDNDGDQDLVLGFGSNIVIMSNDGAGHFKQEKRIPTERDVTSLSAADYDRDGRIDIYICCNTRVPSKGGITGAISGDESGSTAPETYIDANNGGENLLLHNEGFLRFTFVNNKQVGLDQNNNRYSVAASWEDYDQDGDVDLYVANDFGRNNLYRNDNGFFVDVAAQAGVEDIAAGMSVSWGDYNNDGLMDLYVGNMFSSAGNRITRQGQFKPGMETDRLRQFQRHARGNSLFENTGDGKFRDVSVSSAVTIGRWAWASNFIDINNDGWEDVFVANGYITQQDSGDL